MAKSGDYGQAIAATNQLLTKHGEDSPEGKRLLTIRGVLESDQKIQGELNQLYTLYNQGRPDAANRYWKELNELYGGTPEYKTMLDQAGVTLNQQGAINTLVDQAKTFAMMGNTEGLRVVLGQLADYRPDNNQYQTEIASMGSALLGQATHNSQVTLNFITDIERAPTEEEMRDPDLMKKAYQDKFGDDYNFDGGGDPATDSNIRWDINYVPEEERTGGGAGKPLASYLPSEQGFGAEVLPPDERGAGTDTDSALQRTEINTNLLPYLNYEDDDDNWVDNTPKTSLLINGEPLNSNHVVAFKQDIAKHTLSLIHI